VMNQYSTPPLISTVISGRDASTMALPGRVEGGRQCRQANPRQFFSMSTAITLTGPLWGTMFPDVAR